jgi:two-component system, LytTR family, response regulator
MHILVVDDEPLARESLMRVLGERSDIEAVDTAVDAVEALTRIRDHAYDILLLDIRMPEMSGMQMVDTLRSQGNGMPAIIFVTAFNEHAVAAFERHATDYILKPFSAERVNRAIDYAKQHSADDRERRLAEILPHLQILAKSTPRIAIKSKGRILFIDVAEIVVAEAEGNYVLLRQESGSHLLREQISVLADRLSPHGFVRIHRSVLVNAAHVEAVKPLLTGEYLLRLKNGKEYNVTRTYKKNLKQFATFWLGMDAIAG